MALFAALIQVIINEGPLLLLLLAIFVAGAKRVWIWSRELDRTEAQLTDERIDFMRQLNEMREERDQWRRIALIGSVKPQPDAGHPHESRLAPEP